MKPLAAFHSILRHLSNMTYVASNVAAALCLFASLVTLLYAVIMRYVFLASPSWSDELPSYLGVWMVFFAAGSAARDGEHIALSFLTDSLPRRMVAAWRAAVDLTVLALMAVLVWQGTRLAFLFGVSQRATSLDISMFLPYLSIPVGASLIAIHLADRLVAAAHKGPQTAPARRGAPFERIISQALAS